MPIQLQIENQNFSARTDAPRTVAAMPQMGVSLDWAGFLLCLTFDHRGLTLGVDEAPISKVSRLKALPRSAFELQVAGKHLTYKYAPLLELVSSIKQKGFSKTRLVEEMKLQMTEVPAPLKAVAQLRPPSPQTRARN